MILDGLEEEAFRRSIETQLRHGWAGDAITRLRRVLAPYAVPGGVLPERFLSVTTDHLVLEGWERLGAAMARHDRPGRPVSCIQIALGWPGEDAPGPDAQGLLAPHLEVSYYSDETFPFSQSTRDDLLEGYSYHGCTWSGDPLATETPLALTGIDDLHGALAALEAHLLASDEPDEELIAAGSVGACLLSALLFKAVGERLQRDPLPRPVCVTSGSNGVYPYFDAPVAGLSEDAIRAMRAAEVAAMADTGVPGPRYSSLLVTSIPRARKRAVLVLEGDAAETARLAQLRGQSTDDDDTTPPPHAPTPDWIEPPFDPAPSAPGGPLLAKKPVRAAGEGDHSLINLTHHARPLDPLPGVLEAAPPRVEPQPEPLFAPEPLPEPLIVPVPERVAAPEPARTPEPVAAHAFDMQERLQLLVARNTVQPAAPADLSRPVITPAEAPREPEPAPEPVLSFESDWVDDTPPPPEPPRDDYAKAPAASPLRRLVTGLRNWWQGR